MSGLWKGIMTCIPCLAACLGHPYAAGHSRPERHDTCQPHQSICWAPAGWLQDLPLAPQSVYEKLTPQQVRWWADNRKACMVH